MRYRVYSMKVNPGRWYSTKDEAIRVFERHCRKAGLRPPLHYPPQVSGDFVSTNGLAYPQRKCMAGPRDGHGFVYIDQTNQEAR